ncbi:MAG: membrane integrity-associated transporter subunit PqiC [Nitrospira sp.]|nr:membrane integrity-associated transporter subunit PqiC [Nitrospira sp.]
MTRRIVRAAMVAAIAGLASGCLSSPPTHFYTLSAEAPAGREAAGAPGYRIAIDPVAISEVVDRPQFVVRSGPNTVSFIEEHRWAESLKREIPRVLAENLGRLLGTEEVWVYPQHRIGSAGYRLVVDFPRFETNNEKDVSLEAFWTIKRALPDGSDQRKQGRSSIHLPVAGEGYRAIASAYSRALAVVSEEIAAAIRSMEERTP